MKKRFWCLGICVVLLLSLFGCNKVNTSDQGLLWQDLEERLQTVDAENFMDRDHAKFIGAKFGSRKMELEVQAVYDGFFLAIEPDSPVYIYKVNYECANDFRAGDEVSVRYEDAYRVARDGRIEMDATSVTIYNEEDDVFIAEKPVIYLYPEKETDIFVSLKIKGELTVTDPLYQEGWQVTAYPDGRLIHQGREYPYLFWEAESEFDFDLSRGFCVAGADTEPFLKEKLRYLGLNEKESAEFMEYWLPRMEQNPYNYITFQQEEYTSCAELEITPAPDCVIRVFMAYRPLEEPIQAEAQELKPAQRFGYSAIEWGGTELSQVP
ncbi:MAG: hypothetical protein IJN34_07275 [Clostridia bacterium]|nr:hypothetical protein [Clostridia bacterium]